MDTNLITNNEFGIYSGIDLNIFNENLKINTTLRLDKNENFKFNFSPNFYSIQSHRCRYFKIFVFFSTVRNPTLSDNIYIIMGRAILIGNLEGHGKDYGENLVTVESLRNYFLPVQLIEIV